MSGIKERIWEIDALRGLAIILMVLFHIAVDLQDVLGYNLDYRQGMLFWTGRLSALLFIVICGVSVTISSHNIRNGMRILAAAFIVSGGTYLYDPVAYVRFGILHFLGTAVLSANAVRNGSAAFLGIGVIGALALGFFFQGVGADTSWGLALGIMPRNFITMDYYPIFPWYGVFLTGIFFGRCYYKNGTSCCPGWRISSLEWMGRHSLAIYLVHQPVLLAILLFVEFVGWQ